MKKYMFLLAFFAILISSCKKQDETSGLEGIWYNKSVKEEITYKGLPYEGKTMSPFLTWEYTVLSFVNKHKVIISDNCPVCNSAADATNYIYENNSLKILYMDNWLEYSAVGKNNILTITIDKDQYLKYMFKLFPSVDSVVPFDENLISDDYNIKYTITFTTDLPQ